MNESEAYFWSLFDGAMLILTLAAVAYGVAGLLGVWPGY